MIKESESKTCKNVHGSLEDFLCNFSNPEKILTKLDHEIVMLKATIRENLQKQDVNKNDLVKVYKKLLTNRDQLITCRNDLQSFFDCDELKEIKNCQSHCSDQRVLISQITVIDKFFNLCLEIKNLLKNSQELLKQSKYYESYKCICQARDQYSNLNSERENLLSKLDLDSDLTKDVNSILKKFSSGVTFLKEEHLYNLIQLFKKNVIFETEETKKKFIFQFLTSLSEEQYESYLNCILDERYDFIMYFKTIFDTFNSEYVRGILQDQKKASLSKDGKIIKIKLIDSNEDCIECLQEFFEIVLDIFTLENKIQRSPEVIQFIGQLWSEPIFISIINDYFEQRLPRLESEFETFLNHLKKGDQIEMKMISLGMIEQKSSVLEEYSKNIQKHFSTKLCQDFIVRMKKILNKPKSQISSDELLEKLSLVKKSKFALCQVNDYMVQVKDLFEEMSALLSNSSSNLRLLLTETIYLVCELFIAISPYKFREEIETDAKQNGIFHNDCLCYGYLIECLVLTHKPQLDSLFELVPCIRNVGSQILLNQMKFQERTLSGYMKNNQTFKNSLQEIANEIPSTDVRISSQCHFEFRECLNNCLKHLNHLYNSFEKTLPKKIENKCFSSLICTILNEFIESILSLNDISSLGSSHLYNEIDYFAKELKLFLVDNEMVIFKWMKLNEINFLLKSSLLEILNRWADGKGILATYLKPDEVKHLIRALFQNNERRANVLAKIK